MGDNSKKNSGKTINFAERKKTINNRQSQASSHKNVVNDNRVIQYDINKMREQINQQTKKKMRFFSSDKSPLWVKLIYAGIILVFAVLVLAKFTNNFGIVKKSNIPSRFEYQSKNLDTEDTVKYESIIETRLKNLISSDGDIEVVTSSLHKNDKYVFADGYFTYPNDSDKIFFDATIVSDKLTSLIINGYNLIK